MPPTLLLLRVGLRCQPPRADKKLFRFWGRLLLPPAVLLLCSIGVLLLARSQADTGLLLAGLCSTSAETSAAIGACTSRFCGFALLQSEAAAVCAARWRRIGGNARPASEHQSSILRHRKPAETTKPPDDMYAMRDPTGSNQHH